MGHRHPFHILEPSGRPFAASISAFITAVGAVFYMHGYPRGGLVLFVGLLSLLTVMSRWWVDVINEAYAGYHTSEVQKSHRLGVVLFIVSEVMFFFGFFWAFFHSSLAPTVQIGCVWPPAGIAPFDPWGVPLLNTLILLLSGLTITAVHHYILAGHRYIQDTQTFFGYTLVLAVLFTCFQLFEYLTSPFSISDGIYGSTFFMATGFHGFHVIVGAIFIFVCAVRSGRQRFTPTHHVGFEAAAWYWHFVDVVWLFLFVSIYWWGAA